VTLSEEAQRAAGAVEAFRAANGLVQTGRTASLDQEQLLERSSELSVTRAETTRLEARLATIEDLMSKPDMSGIVVSDVLGNTAVSRLRESLVTVSAEIRDLTARFGPESEASRSARATAETLQRGIREELERIRKAYAADLAAARRREQNVDTALDHMMVETTRRSQAHVELAELESRASTYRRLYEGVLMQFETATQKASFPVSDARIVTPAMVPLNRSHPQTMLILAMALAVGAASGLGTAVMRESLDRRIARSGQIRRELGLPFLGAVVHTRCGKQARMIGRLQSGRADPLEAVVVGRTSAFGESIRGVKASIDLALPQPGARVIMIASVADGEGKTTVASTLALLFAVEGSRVLLIDTKGDGPSLRERLAPTLSALADVLAPTPISQMPGPVRTCRSDPDARSERGHLEVLSAATLPLNGKTQHRAAAAMIRSHLPLFRDRFDVVILDTPALERSSEARVLNPHVDGLVLVCEHRRTTVDRMAHAVLSFGATQHRLIGIVLNKVPRNWRND
jgi:succinoglycan biosynthesis transport protein ExoP